MGRFGLRDELQIKKYPQPEHFGPLSGLVIYSFIYLESVKLISLFSENSFCGSMKWFVQLKFQPLNSGSILLFVHFQ